MTVVEHRTIDTYYDDVPTVVERERDVEYANTLGRVTRWRIIKVKDPTYAMRWTVRVYYDEKPTDA